MADKVNEIYRCEICGNMVEILHSGVGEILCCNEPMSLVEAGSILCRRCGPGGSP